jgi:hypothetical protein
MARPQLLPGEHLGGSRGVEQASEPEPADHAATDPLGERGQIGLGDGSGWDERRRCVTDCLLCRRHEDAVGDAGVEMHVAVERRAKAVQEGDATEPRAGGTRYLRIRGPPDAASRSRSISVRKIFVSTATAGGRSARSVSEGGSGSNERYFTAGLV